MLLGEAVPILQFSRATGQGPGRATNFLHFSVHYSLLLRVHIKMGQFRFTAGGTNGMHPRAMHMQCICDYM